MGLSGRGAWGDGIGTGYSWRRWGVGQKALNYSDQLDNTLERSGRTRTRDPDIPRQASISGLSHVEDDMQPACPP